MDQRGRPSFTYNIKGTTIHDKIVARDGNRYLSRTFKIDKAKRVKDLWFLLASGNHIEKIEEGLYSIDAKTYYIQILASQNIRPIIRKTKNGAELLACQLIKIGTEIKYSIIW